MVRLRMACVLSLLLVLGVSCGDDGTGPSDSGGSASVHSLMLVNSADGAGMKAVTALPDGGAAIVGYGYGTLKFSDSSTDSLIGSGSDADIVVMSLRPDGTRSWARVFDAVNDQLVGGVASDASGNLFVAGRYFGNTTLGGVTLSNQGEDDLLLMKLDPSGNPLWIKGAGGTQGDFFDDVVALSDGGCYAVGHGTGAFTFAGTNTGNTGNWGAVISVASNGVRDWADLFRSDDNVGATCVATNATNDAFVGGWFAGTLALPGSVSFTASGYDVFLSRLRDGGIPLWQIQLGGDGGAFPYGIAVLNDGVVMIGTFIGNLDCDMSAPGGELTSNGNDHDCFVARYDLDGVFQWAKRFGGAGKDNGYDVAPYGVTGDVVIAGQFVGPVDFGTHALRGLGDLDGFVARLDPSGRVFFAEQIGGLGGDYAAGVASLNGRVLTVGYAQGDVQAGGISRHGTGPESGFIYRR